MPQIPSYGYDETSEGDLNSAKRRIIGFMDSTHERLTEYPDKDPTNGEVSVELAELTDDIYIAIKSIETLDSFVRIDQMVADVVSLAEQSAELKKTARELLNVNNSLRKINATYDKLRPNTKYVQLSIWTDFTSAVDLLRKAAYKFYSYMDNLIGAERRRRGEDYDPPIVAEDDDGDDDPGGGPGGGPDGGPDGGDDAPPDDGGDEGVLTDYDVIGELPGSSPPAFGPPLGAPPPSPPAPPPSAPKPPKKPAVPVLSLPPLPEKTPSDPPPPASPSTDGPPSLRPSLGDKMGLRPYEKLGKDKSRTFSDAYREYTTEANDGTITDKAWDMSQTDTVSKEARSSWIDKLETYYNDKRRLPTRQMRYKLLLDAIKEATLPPPLASPAPLPAPLPAPPSKKPKPVLSGPLAELPPPRPSPPIAPPVASPPPKAPSKFSDDELFWPDLVAETIASTTDIEKLKALPTWPDLTTSQQKKFEDRFNLDKATLASGQTPAPLKANTVYFTAWKKLLGTSTPRTFKQILGTSKTPRKVVKV